MVFSPSGVVTTYTNVGTAFNPHPDSMAEEIPRFRRDVRACHDGRKRGVFGLGRRKTLDRYYVLDHFQWATYGFTDNPRVGKRSDWGFSVNTAQTWRSSVRRGACPRP